MNDKVNTEKKIIDLSLELLQFKGINGFSFADIANEIGIKKASIHYYFPTKNDLINKIIEKYGNFVIDYLKKDENIEKDLEGSLNKLVNLHKKEVSENKNILYVSLIVDRENLDDGINRNVDLLCDKIIIWIENILIENNFPKNKAKEIAEEFFSIIVGVAIFSKNKNVEIFDKIIKNKISEIVYISRFFK